jgi:hypothetical protein
MGRFADILGTLADGFRIGPKGAQGLADMSGLTADRTYTFPDSNGTVVLNGKLAFATADGTSSPIPLTTDNALPFTLASGSTSNIPMTT